MPDPHFDTIQLQRWIELWQAGDATAADELLQAAAQRLEHLTRKMLRGFPNVRVGAETNDVLQGALIRLLKTLGNIQPESTRHFYRLAALHIRRELLDLARTFQRQRLNPFPVPAGDESSQGGGLSQVPARDEAEEDLEAWCRFHEAVEELPIEEREVVGLVFYHGWTQARVAELFQINVRTVRRWWEAALVKLYRIKDRDR